MEVLSQSLTEKTEGAWSEARQSWTAQTRYSGGQEASLQEDAGCSHPWPPWNEENPHQPTEARP